MLNDEKTTLRYKEIIVYPQAHLMASLCMFRWKMSNIQENELTPDWNVLDLNIFDIVWNCNCREVPSKNLKSFMDLKKK